MEGNASGNRITTGALRWFEKDIHKVRTITTTTQKGTKNTRQYAPIMSDNIYLVMGNKEKRESIKQQMIGKPPHLKDPQVGRSSRYEPQTVAALAYYNYYLAKHEGEKITGPGIEEFDKKLKDDANVEDTILYKSLMQQQEYNRHSWNGTRNFGEPLSFQGYFQRLATNRPSSSKAEKSTSGNTRTSDAKEKSKISEISMPEPSVVEDSDAGKGSTSSEPIARERSLEFEERLQETKSDVGATTKGLLTSDSTTELCDDSVEVGITEDSDSIESFTLNSDKM